MTSTFPEVIQSIPSVPLLVIDYNLLVQKDLVELGRLFKASTELGFFYLKLDNQLDPAPMFTLAEKLFELPLDIKMKYLMDGKNGVYFGYKAVGSMFIDRKGTPDKIEFWNISKDEIIVQDRIEFPEPIIDAKSTVKEYMMKSHEIVLVILQALSENLGLGSRALADLHRFMEASGDQLRLTKSTLYPTQNECSPDVALLAHTDFGSVTILFNQLWGLQVLTPNGDWLYVRPLSGHAIINLGDSMVKFSDGLIKSNIHRVITMPWLTEAVDRYSVVYFARPENDVQMKSLMNNGKEEQCEDHVFTAQEWIARRVKNLQTENYKDEKTYEMSRGTEAQREPDDSM
jgi:isopenicillin N synthase-like dioxygenase